VFPSPEILLRLFLQLFIVISSLLPQRPPAKSDYFAQVGSEAFRDLSRCFTFQWNVVSVENEVTGFGD
jgi:hypothetical protein